MKKSAKSEINKIELEDKSNAESKNNPNINKQSNSNIHFSKYEARRLKKAKRNALDFGVLLPELDFPLEKPQKLRHALFVAGFIMLGVTLAIGITLAFLFVKFNIFNILSDLFDSTKQNMSNEEIKKTLGISTLGSLGTGTLTFMIITILLCAFLIICVLIMLTKKIFILSSISRQEMAEGQEVQRFIAELCVWAILSVVISIIIIAKVPLGKNMSIILAVVGFIIAFASCALLVPVIAERKKDSDWFKELPMERQADFIRYNNAIKEVEKRKGLDTSRSSQF